MLGTPVKKVAMGNPSHCMKKEHHLQTSVMGHWDWFNIVIFDMAMDQYLLIPFLVGWTSIYQLFWCSPGVQGFDTLPYDLIDDLIDDLLRMSGCHAIRATDGLRSASLSQGTWRAKEADFGRLWTNCLCVSVVRAWTVYKYIYINGFKSNWLNWLMLRSRENQSHLTGWEPPSLGEA